MLLYEGFEDVRIFGSDGSGSPREKDERIFISCRKK